MILSSSARLHFFLLIACFVYQPYKLLMFDTTLRPMTFTLHTLSMSLSMSMTLLQDAPVGISSCRHSCSGRAHSAQTELHTHVRFRVRE